MTRRRKTDKKGLQSMSARPLNNGRGYFYYYVEKGMTHTMIDIYMERSIGTRTARHSKATFSTSMLSIII